MTQAKVAVFSPLPPVPSGISDYTVEILPHLRRQLDISLVPDHYAPELPRDLAGLPILSPDGFRGVNPSFLAVYQMGNSMYHEYMLRSMSVNPGIVVLHDTNLHGLLYHLTASRGRLDLYRSILAREHGMRGALAADAVAAGSDPPIYEMPLTGRLLDQARAIIVHSAKAQRALQLRHPGLTVEWIPMGVQSAGRLESPLASRLRLGLPAEAFIVGSFGHFIPKKRIHIALQAFSRFARAFPSARYLLVGSGYNGYPEVQVQALDLSQKVSMTGFVPRNSFRDFINAVDVCINLRHPDDGETSATLIRAMAAGKPVLYSESGPGPEIPLGAGVAIPTESGEVDAIADALVMLATDPLLRKYLGENARRHYLDYHRPETAALRYHALIVRTLEGSAPPGFSGINGGNAVENGYRFAGHSGNSRWPRHWGARRPPD